MNNLIKIGLISAIMATSGMASVNISESRPGILHNCGTVNVNECETNIEKIINYHGELTHLDSSTNLDIKDAEGTVLETINYSYVFKNTEAVVNGNDSGDIIVEDAFLISQENTKKTLTKITSYDGIILSTVEPLADQSVANVRWSDIISDTCIPSGRTFKSKHESNAVNLIVDRDVRFENDLYDIQYGQFIINNQSTVDLMQTIPANDVLVSDGATLNLLSQEGSTERVNGPYTVFKSLTIGGGKYFAKNPLYKRFGRGKLEMNGASLTIESGATLTFEPDKSEIIPEFPYQLPTEMVWKADEFTGADKLDESPLFGGSYTDGFFYYKKTTDENGKVTYTRRNQNLLLPGNVKKFSYNNIKSYISFNMQIIAFHDKYIKTPDNYIFSGNSTIGIYSGPVNDSETYSPGETFSGLLLDICSNKECTSEAHGLENTASDQKLDDGVFKTWYSQIGMTTTDETTYGDLRNFIAGEFDKYFAATKEYEMTGEVPDGATVEI